MDFQLSPFFYHGGFCPVVTDLLLTFPDGTGQGFFLFGISSAVNIEFKLTAEGNVPFCNLLLKLMKVSFCEEFLVSDKWVWISLGTITIGALEVSRV